MTTTFYGVLGVEPDADADTIRRGYRERAAEVHPDVNDDPDADSQFRRLTTARDTLLDETERARYDRLGHTSYVRHHVSGSAWAVDDRAGPQSPDRGSRRSARGTDSKGGDGSVSAGPAEPSGAGAHRSSRPGAETAAGSDPASTDNEPADTHRRSPGSRSGHRRGRGAGRSRPPGAAASESRVDGETWWQSRGSTRGTGGTRGSGEEVGGSRSVGDAYATSTFWDSQRVGERHGTGSGHANSPLGRVIRGVRALGPWVVVHAVFLSVALGTSWYAYAVVLADTTRPLPLLVALVGAMTLAVLLSVLHVVSRVYR